MTPWCSRPRLVHPWATNGGVRFSLLMVDMGTGLYSTVAMLMALHERALWAWSIYRYDIVRLCRITPAPYLANYLFSDKVPQITGNQHRNIAPYDKYPTKSGTFISSSNVGSSCAVPSIGTGRLADDQQFKDNGERSGCVTILMCCVKRWSMKMAKISVHVCLPKTSRRDRLMTSLRLCRTSYGASCDGCSYIGIVVPGRQLSFPARGRLKPSAKGPARTAEGSPAPFQRRRDQVVDGGRYRRRGTSAVIF